MTPIRDRLQAALAEALRSRDALRISVLRTTLSTIANAEAVEVPVGQTATEVPRRHLTEDDVRAVVTAERVELESAAAELRIHDRADAASELEAKAAVLTDALGNDPDGDDDALLDEQLTYYDDRAPVYDEAYTRTGHNDRGPDANERWWSELRIVEAALDRAGLDGDVLELGCGTGYWTERLAARARSITALDGSEHMLRLARRRLGDATNVTFEQVDILREWTPTGQVDAVVAFFFLEHVPDTRIDRLLGNVASALPSGGRVFVAEGLHREPAPAVEHRHLHGHEYRVVERRRREDEFVAAFGRHGLDIEYNSTPHLFCFLEGTKTG